MGYLKASSMLPNSAMQEEVEQTCFFSYGSNGGYYSMIDYQAALAIAKEHIDRISAEINSEREVDDEDLELALFEEFIEEKAYGWIFYYQIRGEKSALNDKTFRKIVAQQEIPLRLWPE